MRLQVFKFSATGNTFVLLDLRQNKVSRARPNLNVWAKKLSANFGSDGLLVVEPQNKELELKFFNPDGSRTFCGNGTRAAGYYAVRFLRRRRQGEVAVMTNAGPIPVYVSQDRAMLTHVPEPRFFGPVTLRHPQAHRSLSLAPAAPPVVYKVWSGCPHAVIFVKTVKDIGVAAAGSLLRCDPAFAPEGSNIDFVSVENGHSLHVRTYERGVERETASCGSGALAAAWAARALGKVKEGSLNIMMPGGALQLMQRSGSGLCLGGKVELLFEGWAYV